MDPLQDMIRKADRHAALARNSDERATYMRVAQAVREVSAGALEPAARASFTRVRQAFDAHAAASSARTAEVQAAFNRSMEAFQPSSVPIANTGFNLIRGRLPASVQAILEKIDDKLDEVRVLRMSLVSDQQDLVQRRAETISQIRMNTEQDVASRYGITFLMSEEDPQIVNLRGNQTKIEKRLAKISEKLEESQPRFAALDKLQERAADYCRQLVSNAVEFVMHDGKQSTKKQVDLKQAIAEIRQKVATLNADLQEIRARPRPSAEVKAQARALVAATARAPLVLQAIQHGDPIQWPVANITAEVVGGVEIDGRKVGIPNAGAAAFGGINDALGVVVWAHQEAILTAFDREIDAHANDDRAMSDEDRTRGEADLIARILLAERDEENLIRQAEEQELPIHRRGNADPRCVLGLASSLPALAEIV